MDSHDHKSYVLMRIRSVLDHTKIVSWRSKIRKIYFQTIKFILNK